MQINDVATQLGVFQEVDALCDSDISSYPVEAKTRRANIALEELELIALMADGKWRFDDKNYSTNPTGLQTLVTGTQEYTFDSTLLILEYVEVLMLDGIHWQRCNPIDITEEFDPSNQQALTGLPNEYYKRGNKIGLMPIPTTGYVTLTNGLKVTFKRQASLFTASDTTKEPGIASPFHGSLFAKKIALPYCKTYKKDRVSQLQADINEETKLFRSYYANRSNDGEDGRTKLGMGRINPR